MVLSWPSFDPTTDGKRVVDVKYYTNVTTTTRVETNEKKAILSPVELKDKEIQVDEVSEDGKGGRGDVSSEGSNKQQG